MLNAVKQNPWSRGNLPYVFSRPDYMAFVVIETVSLCSSAWPGTLYGDQVDVKLKRSACTCLLSTGIKGMCHHSQVPAAHFWVPEGLPIWQAAWPLVSQNLKTLLFQVSFSRSHLAASCYFSWVSMYLRTVPAMASGH